MPKVPIQGMSLSMLADGYAGRAIDSGLEQIARDILDRGHDGQKRVLTIKVTFEPADKGRCSIDLDVGVKIPGYRPPTTVAKYDQAAGGLVFNPEASENPDQMTIGDAHAEE